MNVLETAMILGDGTLALPEEISRRSKREPAFSAAVRAAIEDALRATRGKIYGADGAAARLGMPPGTLQSKMRKLAIDRAAFTS